MRKGEKIRERQRDKLIQTWLFFILRNSISKCPKQTEPLILNHILYIRYPSNVSVKCFPSKCSMYRMYALLYKCALCCCLKGLGIWITSESNVIVAVHS